MKIRIAFIMLLILYSISISSAKASQIREYCEKNPYIKESYAMLEACIQQEEDAKRRLEMRTIDPKIISYCKGNPYISESYSLLEACVQQEEEAKRRLGN